MSIQKVSTGPRAAELESGTQQFLRDLAAKAGPPIYTVEEARELLSAAQSGDVPRPPADIDDRVFPVGPTGRVDVRIVRPQGMTRALPTIVFVHGGGCVLGGKDTHDRMVRELAHGAQAALVFVDYARSPEVTYPVALEQVYAATQFVVENADALNVDATRLAIVGDSAGGNIATAVTMLAKQRGGPRIDFQLLFYPVTDATFDSGSYRQYAKGYLLTRRQVRWFWDQYLPDAETRKQPTASPLLAADEHLRGLPPALVITAECDVLRDEGEAYAQRLAEAGVRVTAVRFLGTIHDFVMHDGLADTPAARAALALANDTLRRALHG